ncbi:MAG: TonB-dependent receptor [Acidobacteria bacterium]|nr:TonB-dependent receptor [Acidobacteriota bacterium]
MQFFIWCAYCFLQIEAGALEIEVVGGPRTVLIEVRDKEHNLVFSKEIENTTTVHVNNLKIGVYTIRVADESGVLQEHNVEVNSTGITPYRLDLDTAIAFNDAIVVTAASRRRQSIYKAPAAVSVLRGFDLEAGGQPGQLPFALNHLPGVQISQTGTFDFNLNTRGLNSFLNRRVVVLIDGRNTAVTQLGNQEWYTVGLSPNEIESIELVHGPGSALYGANAFNGVLDIRTKSPGANPGGSLQLNFGEQNSWGAQLHHNWQMGDRWSVGLKMGTFAANQWEQSRTMEDPIEYEGVPFEVIPLDRPGTRPDGTPVFLDTRLESRTASLRADFKPNPDWVVTAELGTGIAENFVGVADIGRGHIRKVERPWARLAASCNTVHFSFWRSERETPEDEHFLASGGVLWEDSYDQQAELTWEPVFDRPQFSLVVGASYHWQDLDTSKPGDPSNQQSSVLEPVKADQQSLFFQGSWQLNDDWELVVADRYDRSSLHESRHSPKAALIWTPQAQHSMRLTYNKAFQPPSFPDYFLYARAGTLDLSPLEAALEAALGPLPTDFGLTPLLALGNESLMVERIESYELGYRGNIHNTWFVTANLYRSDADDFVTELTPGVNPNIAPYQLPAGLPDALQQVILGALQNALGPFYAGLSNAENGSPILTLSYTNAGQVDLTGAEITVNWVPSSAWQFDVTYHWLDFETEDANLVSNAPSQSIGGGLVFRRSQWNVSTRITHRDGYESAGGIFRGDVPSYAAWDAQVSYRFSDHWQGVFNGTNLLDDAHFDQFGGALIGRMTSLSCRYSW